MLKPERPFKTNGYGHMTMKGKNKRMLDKKVINKKGNLDIGSGRNHERHVIDI